MGMTAASSSVLAGDPTHSTLCMGKLLTVRPIQSRQRCLAHISEAIVQNSNTSDCQDQSPKSNNFTPSCASTSKSPGERRRRIVFSLHQLHVLQQTFEEHRYVSQKKRQDLAKELGLTEVQVKCWFQNRRMKIKRQYVTKPPQRPPSSIMSSPSMNYVSGVSPRVPRRFVIFGLE
uniref:Homeobox domain-containing protein n=1 Tax=Eptatretus burgeri TaxID=7764 RepID=A0A8C4PYW7_EPTBU